MLTQGLRWATWFTQQTIRRASAQSSEFNTRITVWFYDGDRYETTLWRGAVPDGILPSYSQEQNDADLAAYDALYAVGYFNNSVQPRSGDGRLLVQPVTLDKNEWHNYHASGDSSSTIGAGVRFKQQRTAVGENTPVVWNYRDPVKLVGGLVEYDSAAYGDYVDFMIYAPATPVVANGGGTGNCNVVSGVIIPTVGDGAFDVDLDDAHPVPSTDSSGYWDYGIPTDMLGKGTISAGTLGEAPYLLLTSDTPLVHFINTTYILGSRVRKFFPENIKPTTILPEWSMRCTLGREASGLFPVSIVWEVLASRYSTTL